MALFWHQLFATGNSKVDNPPELTQQIAMFRRCGLGKFRDILLELAQNPAMIFWLDNNGNHRGAINENWGRELLELFSMGVGNYSEDDIKEASRAFTGWTIGPQDSPQPPWAASTGTSSTGAEDHDDGEKTFLGHTGNFNGQDIINLVVEQPATARFLSRHLYNFFVADEPQVPSWNITPPNDPDAIDQLVAAYNESDGDIRFMLRVLFNSDFFKQARFSRVKSPAELGDQHRANGGQLQPSAPRFQLAGVRVRLPGPGTAEPAQRGKAGTRAASGIDGGALVRRGQLRRRPAGATCRFRACGPWSIPCGIAGTWGPTNSSMPAWNWWGPLEVSEGHPGRVARPGPQRGRTAVGYPG